MDLQTYKKKKRLEVAFESQGKGGGVRGIRTLDTTFGRILP